MTDEYYPVLCCCDPNNHLGYLPKEPALNAGFNLRQLENGTYAFDSQDDKDKVESFPGFRPPENKKTWKKTWKK